MLEVLRFVRGAVAEKNRDLVPVLTHFCVYQGRIQGQDGRLSIDSPCPELQFEGVVPADRFLRAVDACEGEPKLKVTDKGKLVVERKPFRAMLPMQPLDAFPRGQPTSGKKHKLTGPLVGTLKYLRPFMADDAERPWASTVLFHHGEGMALATTNAMIAAVQSKAFSDDVQVPVFCVDELIRIGTEPDYYAHDQTSITFWWGEQWLKAQKIAAEWPFLTAKEWLSAKAKYQPIPKDLASAVERLIPFCNDPKFPVIYFRKDGLSTVPGDTQGEISGFDLGEGAFHSDNLLPMLRCADKMAIGEKVALFTGPNSFKGVMSLLRV